VNTDSPTRFTRTISNTCSSVGGANATLNPHRTRSALGGARRRLIRRNDARTRLPDEGAWYSGRATATLERVDTGNSGVSVDQGKGADPLVQRPI
jgi:hypothetical protein